MGDPKKSRKKYSSPRKLWQADQLSQDLYILGKYGLRNKRELWKAETELSRLRKQARKLLAESVDKRFREEQNLLSSLSRKGIIGGSPTLDDILGLTIENLLERRLQTVVKNKGLVKSIHLARQAVSHGHIVVNDRVVTIPGYLVRVEEEPSVRFRVKSALADISVGTVSIKEE